MRKQIVYYKDTPCRCGCVHNGFVYRDGERYTCLNEDEQVRKVDIKTLAVHTMKTRGIINEEKKIMELEKRGNNIAIVRDEYDNRYIAILCETYYSEFSNGIVIDEVIVTPQDKISADFGAETGDTKKRWVVLENKVALF